MLIVTSRFAGHGYDMPAPGTLIDPPPDVCRDLLAAGCVAEWEVKVLPIPQFTKKKLLELSRPGLVAHSRMQSD